MDVGVTATRRGLVGPQYWELRRWLILLRDEHGATRLHHGDCVGGDAEAARTARELGYRTTAHPPLDGVLRAYDRADEIRPPLPYKERDRAIVAACRVLIGCPDSVEERLRSGTWYTIRQARVCNGHGLVVIAPDGRVLERRGLDDPRDGAA